MQCDLLKYMYMCTLPRADDHSRSAILGPELLRAFPHPADIMLIGVQGVGIIPDAGAARLDDLGKGGEASDCMRLSRRPMESYGYSGCEIKMVRRFSRSEGVGGG